MSNKSDGTKLVVAVVAVVVLVSIVAVAAAVWRSESPEVQVVERRGDGGGSSVSQQGTLAGDAGSLVSATAGGRDGGNTLVRAAAGGSSAGGGTGGGTVSGGGFIPGSVDISHRLGAGKTQVPADFRPSQRVADALGFRRTVQEVNLPDEARELLRQHEYDNHDEILGLLGQSDADLNAAFEAMLASERAGSPVTSEAARAELVKTFAEHLKLLHDVNNSYFMEAQRHLDNRGKASLIHQFDQYQQQVIEIPYTVGGTNKPAVTLRGNVAQYKLEVVDGETVFPYTQAPDGLSYVPLVIEEQ